LTGFPLFYAIAAIQASEAFCGCVIFIERIGRHPFHHSQSALSLPHLPSLPQLPNSVFQQTLLRILPLPLLLLLRPPHELLLPVVLQYTEVTFVGLELAVDFFGLAARLQLEVFFVGLVEQSGFS